MLVKIVCCVSESQLLRLPGRNKAPQQEQLQHTQGLAEGSGESAVQAWGGWGCLLGLLALELLGLLVLIHAAFSKAGVT